MLIKVADLERIKAGEVTVLFRRWKQARVKQGSTLRTPIGILSVESVLKTTADKITAADARRAGYKDRTALLRELETRYGDIFRIQLNIAGEDPRIHLREADQLTSAEMAELITRLSRMDQRMARGPWTHVVLKLIAENPRVRAQDLADSIDMDKQDFKARVRKLKDLGLTISHETGYELSPRGKKLLKKLD